MLTFQAVGATDVGLRRSNNEDAFLCRPETGVLALSDGMGGPPAGEVASAIFVDAVAETFGGSAPASVDAATALLYKVFRLAHKRLIAHAADHPDHLGLGCTAELLVFCAERYLLGHLGDSRVYLFRDRELRRITSDHSLVQQMVDEGVLAPEAAQGHPMKNVILRVLSADSEPVPQLFQGAVFPGDLFLLCSDGLTEMLEDRQIEEMLSGGGLLYDLTEQLIQAAKSAGGSDNVTVMLCQATAETD